VQDALEAQAVGSGEGGGGGSLTVGGDQDGDVALIDVVAQAPRTLRARSRGSDRLLRATVWQKT
jgi:hypothetical protein